MVDFEKALIKGEIGEEIVTKYLEKKGWIVYRPYTKKKAHFFDMICTYNKEKTIAIDIKTKARLNNWNAQGINIKSYNQYLNFVNETKVNFYLIFVDDKTGDVHLADITKLKKPIYPNKNIIAWRVEDMKFLFTISTDEIESISIHDQRNYEFKPKQ
jgi:Holliday junction resolvase